MELKILQTNNRNYVFMDYEFAKAHEFNIGDYEEVYNTELPDYTEFGMLDEEVLEEMFEIFNVRHPKDYKARSLSVSDIVILGQKKFYCDTWGWKKID